MRKNIIVFRKATELRKNGRSYSEIKSELGVAKSTLSDWFNKKPWSDSIKKRLNGKYLPKNRNRIVLMNKSRALKKIKRDSRYLREANAQYNKMKKVPLFVAGLMIYWGEGEKFATGRIAVINTEAKMIQVMINFITVILKVPKEKIRAGLFVYEDLDAMSVQTYWSDVLDLPRHQFIKTHILVSRKRPGKKKSAYGMCTIYVCSTELKFKIMQWIKLFTLEYSKKLI